MVFYRLTYSKQVLTEHLPIPEPIETAAVHSMLTGDRLNRPNHNKISDAMWHMVEQCWHRVPSQRMSIEEVVRLLSAELGQTHDS